MEQFQIKKLPALMVMMMDKQQENDSKEQAMEKGKSNMNLKLATYTGKYNYDQLFSYFNTFVVKGPQIQSNEDNQ